MRRVWFARCKIKGRRVGLRDWEFAGCTVLCGSLLLLRMRVAEFLPVCFSDSDLLRLMNCRYISGYDIYALPRDFENFDPNPRHFAAS